MRSLTEALFRRLVLGAVLVLLVAGAVLYLSVKAQLVRQLDELLTDKAEMLVLSVEEKNYGLEVDLEEMGTDDMEEADTPEYLYIGTSDGRTLYRSNVLEGAASLDLHASLNVPREGWVILPDGRRLRSVLISFIPEMDDEEEDLQIVTGNPDVIIDTMSKPGDQIFIMLLRDVSAQRGFLRLFLVMLLATGIGSIGLLSLTVWIVIKKEAKPINELASRIEAIRDQDLAVRFDEKSVLSELAPIVRKLNVFLNNLEESFHREKGFTSDAAHELRTPLAGLKSTIEVALGRDRKGDEYRNTLQRTLEIVKQLESLVESLLSLARLESGQETTVASSVHMKKCVYETWETYGMEADRKNLRVSLNVNNGSVAVIDSNLIDWVFAELFKNAVYYTDQGGSIRVDMDEGKRNIRIRVSNTGSKVSEGDAERVFDRFWRGSESRDDTGTRFGLGLPIVRKMVEMMEGWIEVETKLGGEFRVTVTLPGE